MADRIRVLVMDDGSRLTRQLAAAVPDRGRVSVAGPVHDVAEAIDALASGGADLIVVDLDRRDGRGHAIIDLLVQEGGRGRVLAVSGRSGPEVAANALAAGASGILPRESGDPLVDAFRRALAGELVLPADDLPTLVDRLSGSARGPGTAAAVDSLTARERDILRTLAAGASTTDVAEAFGISPLTVQSHVKNILAKLGVHSKVEAVRIAWRHGLVPAARP